MKILTIVLLLSLSGNSEAGWLGFLLGVAAGGSQKQPALSETQVKINLIEKTVPRLCPDNLSIYSNCWNQFTSPVQKISIDSDPQTFFNYFKNKGYEVEVNDLKLIFNFKKQHKKFLEHKKKKISLESMILFSLGSSILSFCIFIILKNKRKIQKIKSIYETNPDAVFFWDKNDRAVLEAALSKKILPANWFVQLDNHNINKIIYNNGRSVGIIATSRKNIIKTFKKN